MSIPASKASLFCRKVSVVMACLVLSACSVGGVSIDHPNVLLLEIPIAKPATVEGTHNELIGTVWRVADSTTAVWFSKEDKGVVAHWVDSHHGAIDVSGLLSKSEADTLGKMDASSRTSEQTSRLERHEAAHQALSHSRLPTVPFDLIPVGDHLLLQSRYGNLVFVQYFQFEPGGRRARFFMGVHPAAWAKAAEDLGTWERLKSWLGIGGFQIHPNRAMAVGIRGKNQPMANVKFTGGGSAVQRLVAQHGTTLFDADGWRSEVLVEDRSNSNELEKFVVTFERISLPVPESERDVFRIRAILAFLKGESTATSRRVEDT